MRMLEVVRSVIYRDLLLALRRRGDVLTALGFFVIVTSLFPLAVGPQPELLRSIAAGVIWVAALLASMLSLSRLFEADHADGTLEQMLLGAAPLGSIVAGKVIAHWLVAGVPLVLVSPVLALQFDLDQEALATLALTLIAGTPILSFIGAIGAALTLGARGGGVLLSLLVLPLYVPVLVIGAGAVDAVSAGMSATAHLQLLVALLVTAAVLAPWAIAAALRIAAE